MHMKGSIYAYSKRVHTLWTCCCLSSRLYYYTHIAFQIEIHCVCMVALFKTRHGTAASVKAHHRRCLCNKSFSPQRVLWTCLSIFSSLSMLLLSLSLSAAALSVLRSSEEQTPIPQNKFMGDIEELAASYERKLIEVSVVLIHTATERRISVKCF